MTGTATLAATLTILVNRDPGITEILPRPKTITGMLSRPTTSAEPEVLITETADEVTVAVSVCTSKTTSTPETLRRLATTITDKLPTDHRTATLHIHVVSID